MALGALIVLSLIVSSVSSARIAGFIAFGGSHYITMKNVLEELASRGHPVNQSLPLWNVILLSCSSLKIVFPQTAKNNCFIRKSELDNNKMKIQLWTRYILVVYTEKYARNTMLIEDQFMSINKKTWRHVIHRWFSKWRANFLVVTLQRMSIFRMFGFIFCLLQ